MVSQVTADKPLTKEQQREAVRQEWLARAELTLATAKEAAEGPHAPNPAKMSAHLKSMLDAAGVAECLNVADRLTLAERSKAIEFTVYERAFEQVLVWARGAIRKGNTNAVASFTKTATDIIGGLRKLGLDAAGCDSLKEKLALLRETAAAGDSKKAKADQRDTGPKRYENDRRSFVRYVDPSLVVEMGGKRYQTVDWSLGGLLVGEIELKGAIGSLVTIKVKVEGGNIYEERATIVRYDADKQQLALQFRRFGSALVKIKRECEGLGLDPS
jgi:hypothetical protein